MTRPLTQTAVNAIYLVACRMADESGQPYLIVACGSPLSEGSSVVMPYAVAESMALDWERQGALCRIEPRIPPCVP